jgi:hypothetical protein
LYLFTFGFPPDAVDDPIIVPVASSVHLLAQPNPFTNRFSVGPLDGSPGMLRLYDLLGREVYSEPISQGTRQATLTDPILGQLPTGTYYLQLDGRGANPALPILHIR